MLEIFHWFCPKPNMMMFKYVIFNFISMKFIHQICFLKILVYGFLIEYDQMKLICSIVVENISKKSFYKCHIFGWVSILFFKG